MITVIERETGIQSKEKGSRFVLTLPEARHAKSFNVDKPAEYCSKDVYKKEYVSLVNPDSGYTFGISKRSTLTA